jgi:hypothetical protein
MRHHKELVELQASLSEFQTAKQARIRAGLEFKAAEEQRAVWRKHHVLSWLNAPDTSVSQEAGVNARRGRPNTGRWLLQRDIYRVWSNPNSSAAQLIWINGIPGAGTSDIKPAHSLANVSRYRKDCAGLACHRRAAAHWPRLSPVFLLSTRPH